MHFLLILWSNGHSLPYLSKLAFLVGMGTLLFDSIAPPPPLPRWAATLQFVIPTGAQRSGGICGAPLHQATPQPLKPSPFGVALRQRELQIPPLRCPGFPVELGGVGEPHAAFRYESRTRGCVRRYVAGNPGPVGMTNLRLAAHLGSGGGGATESNNSNQPVSVCPRSLQPIQRVASFRKRFVR